VADGRTTLRFFRSGSDSDSFFTVACESSPSSFNVLLTSFPLLDTESLIDVMNLIELMNLIDLVDSMRLIDLIEFVNLIELIDRALMIDLTLLSVFILRSSSDLNLKVLLYFSCVCQRISQVRHSASYVSFR